MFFKPYNDDSWYRIKKRAPPDKISLDYQYQTGEFSVLKEQAFEKHLNRLERLNKFYGHLNGKRIKAIIEQEPLWFSLGAIQYN